MCHPITADAAHRRTLVLARAGHQSAQGRLSLGCHRRHHEGRPTLDQCLGLQARANRRLELSNLSQYRDFHFGKEGTSSASKCLTKRTKPDPLERLRMHSNMPTVNRDSRGQLTPDLFDCNSDDGECNIQTSRRSATHPPSICLTGLEVYEQASFTVEIMHKWSGGRSNQHLDGSVRANVRPSESRSRYSVDCPAKWHRKGNTEWKRMGKRVMRE